MVGKGVLLAFGTAQGTNIRWYLINSCAHKEQSLLFTKCRGFDEIERSHKWMFFYPKRHFISHARAACSELPSIISTMGTAYNLRDFRPNCAGRKEPTAPVIIQSRT